MSSRILLICAFIALLAQATKTQCLSTNLPVTLAYAPELTSGKGTFAVRSSSPISPTGVTVLSDRLVIEGPLVIDGQLPFLGTVVLEGAVPSLGVGNVAHTCGGTVAISSEIASAMPVLGSPFGSLAPGLLAAGPGLVRGPACSRLL